jgi:hypothetical protein
MNPEPTSTLMPLILRGRIAFATFVPSVVIIDGVLGWDDSHRTEGIISLRAALPYSAWAVAAGGLIQTWAANDAPVELRFRYSQGKQQVRISDGRSLVLLDLESAPDLRIGERADTQRPICA